MKLKGKRLQPAANGLAASYRERWDIGDGYEIYVDLDRSECLIGVFGENKKQITLEVARFLGIHTKTEDITFERPKDGSELYLVLGIDCVGIGYAQPENYKELLKKIELIVSEKFKNK